MLSLMSRVWMRSTHCILKSPKYTPNICVTKSLNVTKVVKQLTTGTVGQQLEEVSTKSRKIVGYWLMTCGGLTFTTVIIGGITRLTNSGLSMVDWHPFKEFPPLNNNKWIEEFNKYKLFPEFKIRNKDMTLEEFKWIWYMEFIHRTLGRTIGAVYFIPAAIFWYKKWFTKSMKPRVLVFGGLLAFQGLLGWYMVKSGLEEKPEYQRDPKVSHYRLAAHLGTALVFYSLLIWSGLSHLTVPSQTQVTPQVLKFRRYTHMTKGFIFFTALSGALVAGLDAGLVYNSWPLMADRIIPTDLLSQSPKWKNFFENATTVQFDHRRLGELVLCGSTGLWIYSRRLPLSPRTRLAVNCLFAATLLQVTLGVTTLLFYVPKSLAASHQSGALTVLTIALWLSHEMKLLKKLPK
ncbi:cytochrome c oxidase assembly protein COX15 homolog [Oppia nitens]|uniref:cytochrome c oxidase assembly protein COX15 homolog n=1 Tax=Oppia nitens TaxID=1686743 RepID=UPI0023DA05B6|nr:cytochrome c oxidase assembly protein COX15 homolog [Oppia nitens]